MSAIRGRTRGAPPERPNLETHGFARYADHVARYLFAASYCAGARVLDAGTGPGYGAALLAAMGAASVLGVDIDDKSIAHAADRFGSPAVSFAVDDCETLAASGGGFDVICSFENIEHLRAPTRFLQAAGRAMKPGGVLIVSTPDRAATPPFAQGKPHNPHHVNEWYAAEFAELLAGYFGSVELLTQVRTTAHESRKRATDALVRHLKSFSLLSRAVGIASVALRGQSYWDGIRALATAAPSDYPVLSPRLVPFLGSSWCHVALCREPRHRT